MTDFQSNGPKKTILNHSKLHLSAPLPNHKGKWAKFFIDIHNNNPRLNVRTNDPNLEGKENGFGMIRAPLDPILFSMFIERLEEVINHQGEVKYKIEVYSSYMGAGRSGSDDKSPKHSADVWVGKNSEGCVYISVINPDSKWPKIQFFIGPSDSRWAKFVNANGEPCTKAELSRLASRGYVRTIRELVNVALVTNYQEYQPNRGGSSGGQKWSGNKQRTEQAGEEFQESDLPF
jgi:hypothetical protein